MEASEPQFLIHQTSHVYVSETIYFQAIQMNKSMFVWVGKQQAKLNDLSVAMPAFGTQVTYTVKRLGQELEAAVLNDYYENYNRALRPRLQSWVRMYQKQAAIWLDG